MKSLTDRLRTYETRHYTERDGYDVFHGTEIVEVPEAKATLFGSRLRGSNNHLLVLDVDLPIEVRKSKTAGHHHLIVDKTLTWRQYRRVLKALAKAGVVDPKWARATIGSRNGYIAKAR